MADSGTLVRTRSSETVRTRHQSQSSTEIACAGVGCEGYPPWEGCEGWLGEKRPSVGTDLVATMPLIPGQAPWDPDVGTTGLEHHLRRSGLISGTACLSST